MDNENPYYPIFRKQYNNRLIARQRPVAARIEMLSRLEKSLQQNRTKIQEAIYHDFKKPYTQTDLTEIYPVLKEIRYAKSNLRNWLRSKTAENGIAFWFTRNKIFRISKGVCLIISPWNYPLTLTLGPLVSAIAAGNTVIIKPSELTSHISSLMKSMISELFSDEDVCVVEGDHETAATLLELPFDHIHFTGSTAIGSKILSKAVANFTSVTLELGGKSPVYVHHDADIEDAAIKIVTAKLVNAGQTCLAPDYLLAHVDIAAELSQSIKKHFLLFYNKDSQSPFINYASIINTQHFNRLQELIPQNEKKLEANNELIIEPLLIENATATGIEMSREIFGPILPMIKVLNIEEALNIIHTQKVPLSIYIFSKDIHVMKLFADHTDSGSICFNDCAVQFLHPGLPFGGYHHSGSGKAHGHAGFLSMTEERVLFHQRTGFTMAKFLYPPYGNLKKRLINLLLKYF